MAQIAALKKPETFNGPLEAGLRTVALLGASYPRSYDLQRLVGLDYLLVHTGDVGGPDSLHPPAPLQSAELLVRRKLIERALLLMMTRDLIEREVSPEGIKYVAGENAATFLSLLESDYLTALNERAKWLIETFGSSDEVEFRATMRKLFDHWVEEFQAVESSWGAEK
jgi:hypothetical protein